MRTRSSRRRRSAASYTIDYLLAHQPKSLTKHPSYRTMIAEYYASPRLRWLRFNRRCYSLLQRATIEPANLRFFYRTYRLPEDAFFPLFFSIKRDYLAQRERVKNERKRYIVARVRSLPTPVLATIKYLGYLERHYNGAGKSPLWQERLFPRTKKRADELGLYGAARWAKVVRVHVAELRRRYRRFPAASANIVSACFVLEIEQSAIPPVAPPRAEINRAYRKLSLLHHPDRGGDPEMFIEIKRARDILLGG